MPESGPALVANARMYAVTPAVETAWAALFAWAAERAGVPLRYRPHPAPAPLEELWRRDDLGLAFMCGYPFATRAYPLVPVAAPVPAAPEAGGRAVYWTDLVAAADGPVGAVDDARRIGWTVEHSQSGFRAPRRFLADRPRGDRERTCVGPLVTPRRAIEAVLSGLIDVGPLDSYWHALLRAHEPETAARLRTVAATPPTPMPLLVASAGVPSEEVARFGAALLATAAEAGHLLDPLELAGFTEADPERYAALLD